MAKYRYVKIWETERAEGWQREWLPEGFWEKWVRRAKFLDRDDIPMNKYNWFRRVYWTYKFWVPCVWIPKLLRRPMYSYKTTFIIPKEGIHTVFVNHADQS